MIQITPQMPILVAIEAVDGRKGIDSLARLCQDKLQADPFSGCLFLFRSRRGTSIRILVYDGQGFWLAQKRLSQGRFSPRVLRPCCYLRCWNGDGIGPNRSSTVIGDRALRSRNIETRIAGQALVPPSTVRLAPVM